MELQAIILAAGKGTRMKSSLQKVLHKVNHQPMIYYVVKMTKDAGIKKPVIVIGHQGEEVKKILRDFSCRFVYQRKRLGTGHAASKAKKVLQNKSGYTVIVNGDCPFFSCNTLQEMIDKIKESNASLCIATMKLDDNTKGIVIRDQNKDVIEVIEAKDAKPSQRKIREKNAGLYLVENQWLWENIGKIKKSPIKGEYYITELIHLAIDDHKKVEAVILSDHREALGIDNCLQLKTANKIVKKKIK